MPSLGGTWWEYTPRSRRASSGAAAACQPVACRQRTSTTLLAWLTSERPVHCPGASMLPLPLFLAQCSCTRRWPRSLLPTESKQAAVLQWAPLTSLHRPLILCISEAEAPLCPQGIRSCTDAMACQKTPTCAHLEGNAQNVLRSCCASSGLGTAQCGCVWSRTSCSPTSQRTSWRPSRLTPSSSASASTLQVWHMLCHLILARVVLVLRDSLCPPTRNCLFYRELLHLAEGRASADLALPVVFCSLPCCVLMYLCLQASRGAWSPARAPSSAAWPSSRPKTAPWTWWPSWSSSWTSRAKSACTGPAAPTPAAR